MTDHVELGEITVQYTARDEAAVEEVDALREEIQARVARFEDARAVAEASAIPEFDARLAWARAEDDDGGGADE